MLYSLRGTLLEKTVSEVVIECGGVGYIARIPSTTAGALGAIGSEVTIFTHMNVSENDVSLYGFESRECREIFRILTSVSGVGPKAGIAILSVLNPSQIVVAVSSGDHKAFTAASGVGPKLGQRIVLELKDKLAKNFNVEEMAVSAPVGGGIQGSNHVQAIAALTSLGYTQAEAANSIAGIDSELPTQEIIRIALQAIGKGR